MVEERKVYNVLVGKLKGNKPLRRPWHRWEDSIRIVGRDWYGGVWSGFNWLRIGIG
jgi:hypothetical protein